ncbi:MAG: hypothetical protein ABIF89_02405 [bacterium]
MTTFYVVDGSSLLFWLGSLSQNRTWQSLLARLGMPSHQHDWQPAARWGGDAKNHVPAGMTPIVAQCATCGVYVAGAMKYADAESYVFPKTCSQVMEER